MTENPYQPPSIPEEAEPAIRPDYLEAATAAARTRKRPLAVMILSLFYFVIAWLTAWSTYSFVSYMQQTENGMQPMEWAITVLEFGPPIVLMLVGSVGLWLGGRWGFFTLGFYFAVRIAGILQSVVIALLYSMGSPPSGIHTPSMFNYFLRGALFVLAFTYLLTPPVLLYCRIPLRWRWGCLAGLLALGGGWLALQQVIVVRVLQYFLLAG